MERCSNGGGSQREVVRCVTKSRRPGMLVEVPWPRSHGAGCYARREEKKEPGLGGSLAMAWMEAWWWLIIEGKDMR